MFTDTLNAMRNWRPQLVQNIPGEVLEIGVGSGTNLPLYRRATHVWGIEPDAAAAAAAQRSGGGGSRAGRGASCVRRGAAL